MAERGMLCTGVLDQHHIQPFVSQFLRRPRKDRSAGFQCEPDTHLACAARKPADDVRGCAQRQRQPPSPSHFGRANGYGLKIGDRCRHDDRVRPPGFPSERRFHLARPLDEYHARRRREWPHTGSAHDGDPVASPERFAREAGPHIAGGVIRDKPDRIDRLTCWTGTDDDAQRSAQGNSPPDPHYRRFLLLRAAGLGRGRAGRAAAGAEDVDAVTGPPTTGTSCLAALTISSVSAKWPMAS